MWCLHLHLQVVPWHECGDHRSRKQRTWCERKWGWAGKQSVGLTQQTVARGSDAKHRLHERSSIIRCHWSRSVIPHVLMFGRIFTKESTKYNTFPFVYCWSTVREGWEKIQRSRRKWDSIVHGELSLRSSAQVRFFITGHKMVIGIVTTFELVIICLAVAFAAYHSMTSAALHECGRTARSMLSHIGNIALILESLE
jgi:hypothetical protein